MRWRFNDLARTDVCPLVALFSPSLLFITVFSHSLDLSAVTPWARLLHKHHDWYPCVASQQTHTPLFHAVKACIIRAWGPHKHCNIMFSHTALIQTLFNPSHCWSLHEGFVFSGVTAHRLHLDLPVMAVNFSNLKTEVLSGSVGTRSPDRGNQSLFRM